MVSFQLTEEQESLKEMVAKFVQNDMLPVAAKYDESSEFPFEVIRRLGSLG